MCYLNLFFLKHRCNMYQQVGHRQILTKQQTCRNYCWYGVVRACSLFNQSEINFIRAKTFSSIIVSNTRILPREGIQADVFRLRPGDPCADFTFVDGNQIDETQLENCTEWKTFDYFSGSSGAYQGTFIAVGLYSVVLFLIVLLGVLHKQGHLSLKSRSKAKLDDPTYGLAGSGVVRIHAEELKVSMES